MKILVVIVTVISTLIKFSVAFEEHDRCSPTGKPTSIREIEMAIKHKNSNTGKNTLGLNR